MGGIFSNNDDAPPEGMTRAEAEERDELLSAEESALGLMRDPDRRHELRVAEMQAHAYYVSCNKRVTEYWQSVQRDMEQAPHTQTPEGDAIRHQHLTQLRLLQSQLLVALHMRDAVTNGLQAGNGLENLARINRVLRHLSENEAMRAIKELTTAYASSQHDVALVLGQISDIPRTSTKAWAKGRPTEVALEKLRPTAADEALMDRMLRSAPSLPPPPPHPPQPPALPAAARYNTSVRVPADGHS
jgi:hypothetical protein